MTSSPSTPPPLTPNSTKYLKGIEGPSHDINPGDSNVLDYLSLLWPTTLCELIAVETNRYDLQRGVANWRNVFTAEIWTYRWHCYPHWDQEIASH